MIIQLKKSVLLSIAVIGIGISANAQSLDEGIKMVQYERYNAAKKILEPLAAKDPLANYYLGIAEVEQGNVDAAKAIFNKYPEDAANIAGLSRVAFASNNAIEGRKLAMDAAGKAKKKSVEPLVYAADAINYSETKDQLAISQAVDWYKQALEKMDNVNIRIGLGDAYRKLPGNGGAAMTNYETAVKLDPKNSLGYSRIGRLWYATRQNYPDALDNYNKAKLADPSNPLPYKYLADAYNKIGKPEQAKENVDTYYSLSDKSDEDKILLANIRFQNKEYEESIRIGEELLSSPSPKPSLYRLLGWSYYEKGDNEKALQNMKMFFTKEKPANVIALDYTYMAKAYLNNRDWVAADEYFRKSAEVDTSNAQNLKDYIAIGEAYGAIRSDTAYAAAAYWYKKYALEKENASAVDYFNWGKWAYFGKKYDDAEVAYQALQTKFADNASAVNLGLYWRGRTAAAVDSKAETGGAVEFYKKYLDATANDTARDAKDLMQAYQYLAYYYYNKKDKSNTLKYANLILALEPENKFASDVKGAAATFK